MRLRNVSSASFEYQIEEWDYADQAHSPESIAYMVVEAGAHRLANGRAIEAGTVITNQAWKSVTFAAGFTAEPVALSQSQTYQGTQAVITRQMNLDARGFEVRLQEEEDQDGIHMPETIGYFGVGQVP